MISLFRSILFKKEENAKELLDKELDALDFDVLQDELERNNNGVASDMQNIISNKAATEESIEATEIVAINADSNICSAHKGVVTKLNLEGGVINNYILFEKKAAANLFDELSVGCQIEYLSFERKSDNYIKVIKIQKILFQTWEKVGYEEVQEAVAALKIEKPILFNTQIRVVLGMVIKRLPSSISVDTDFGNLVANLDETDVVDFIPHNGDCVSLECNVQLDDKYVDKQGEILQVVKVSPSRRETNQKLTVRSVYNDHIVLSGNAYMLSEDVPKGTNLDMADIVMVDQIECENGEFNHRVIKVQLLEKNFKQQKIHESYMNNKNVSLIGKDSGNEAQEAKHRPIVSETLTRNFNKGNQRRRHYAHTVWSHKAEVVPGGQTFVKRRFIAKRIPNYDVPEKLRKICLTTEQRCEMLDILCDEYPFVSQPLSIANYSKRFSVLLHLEEIDYFISFRKYDRERAHFQRDGDSLSLHVENLAERRPSLVVGDIVRAINPWIAKDSKERVFDGIIHKVLFDRVLLKFNDSFQQKYNGEDYRVEFHFSRFTFRKQHFAVSRMLTLHHQQNLFPTRANKRATPQLDVRFDNNDMYLHDSKIAWYNTDLNSIQKRAVFNILRGEMENSPYIIFGPPGTGKTITLVETILQLVRNLPGARLLVGAPSNSSADLITRRLVQNGELKPGSFVRLVSHNQVEKDLIPIDLMAYSATVDIGTAGSCEQKMITTESGLKLRCQMKYLGAHSIIISTCSTLGNFFQTTFNSNHFTHVLLDEAGQCTEPETMIPIALMSTNNNQVVLAGDPHQLQAIVINREAAKWGLSLSYLERILESSPYRKDMLRYPDTSGYNPHLVSKLLYNYRAVPSIMTLYSKLFYDDELIPMVSDEDSREARLLIEAQKAFSNKEELEMPLKHGIIFHGVIGANLQEPDSPSWYNPTEARQVLYLTVILYRLGIKPEQIGILTPYFKQVKTLRNMFISFDAVMPKIGSVEEFQGQERDIMLISTVRSSEGHLSSDVRLNLGFVKCPKRLNVAISRARSMMVIFGNPHLLSLDDSWRHLILYCANNNAYFGCDVPPVLLPQSDE